MKAGAILVLLHFAGVTLWAAREVTVYGIANFGGRGECGTDSMTHPVHVNTAAAFSKWFLFRQLLGQWDVVRTHNNKQAKGRLFIDHSKSSAGDDSHAGSGADAADVIYVHTHGSHIVHLFPPPL